MDDTHLTHEHVLFRCISDHINEGEISTDARSQLKSIIVFRACCDVARPQERVLGMRKSRVCGGVPKTAPKLAIPFTGRFGPLPLMRCPPFAQRCCPIHGRKLVRGRGQGRSLGDAGQYLSARLLSILHWLFVFQHGACCTGAYGLCEGMHPIYMYVCMYV